MKIPNGWTIPLSREGFLWFILSFAMLVTGLLKGINLITLLACWMVTLVLLNYCWARPQLRKIKARRFFSEFPFAETPYSFLLEIENLGRKPAFGVAVHDPGIEFPVTRFLPKMKPGATANLAITLRFPRRGLHRLKPLSLTTGYPLGQLQRANLRRFLAQQSPTLGQARAFPRRHPGAQSEFHGLRPFRAGDSLRGIHWRTTARRGELMVREFEDMPNDHLVLIVDPGLPGDPLLERLLSLAATICWEWCRQKGNRLALAAPGPGTQVLVGNTGTDCAFMMLERLAMTQPIIMDASFLDSLRSGELPPGPILILSTTGSELDVTVSQLLHRSVAMLNLGRGEEKDFFEEGPPSSTS
jgi:uncharacterized protein (DUF58 family)